MNIMEIVIAAAVIGGVGVIIGVVLGIAGEKFKVEINPLEEEVFSALPGNNCGACGYPGCSGLASAIVANKAGIGSCPVGGQPVADRIAGILGQEPVESVRMSAFVKCAGTCEAAKSDYTYTGVKDCAMMEYMPGGGAKSCSYGCLGFGNCADACPFDAIYISEGIAVVDKDACKACKQCVSACPKNLIEMIPYDYDYAVQCHSQDKGKDVMTVCKAGCIGCRICEKACKFDAVHVEDNLAHIDQEKCTGCGECAEKCPRSIIRKNK